MSPDTFDTETTPETLVAGGLDWRAWGLLCLIMAGLMFGMTCAFLAGAAWQAETQQEEARP